MSRQRAQQLASEFMARADATGWFEALYAEGDFYIVSNRIPSHETITENGTHYGVEVMEKVFDNLSPEGMSRGCISVLLWGAAKPPPTTKQNPGCLQKWDAPCRVNSG